ncbi:hypothetical protein HK098_001897 [Nowakowskiella sp. JEL0407]|nr:hypothetical protein HK098_001897 [Nowakowskiella sp. JEL0407]
MASSAHSLPGDFINSADPFSNQTLLAPPSDEASQLLPQLSSSVPHSFPQFSNYPKMTSATAPQTKSFMDLNNPQLMQSMFNPIMQPYPVSSPDHQQQKQSQQQPRHPFPGSSASYGFSYPPMLPPFNSFPQVPPSKSEKVEAARYQVPPFAYPAPYPFFPPPPPNGHHYPSGFAGSPVPSPPKSLALKDASVQTEPVVFADSSAVVPPTSKTVIRKKRKIVPKGEPNGEIVNGVTLPGEDDAGDETNADVEMGHENAMTDGMVIDHPEQTTVNTPAGTSSSSTTVKKRKNIPQTVVVVNPADIRMGHWSDGESQRLLDAVDEFGKDWGLVSEKVGKRSKAQCEKRWRRVISRPDDRYKFPPSAVQAIAAAEASAKEEQERILKKKQTAKSQQARKWDAKDSMELVLAVRKLGEVWEEVAKLIRGGGYYTAAQCEMRWKELEAQYSSSSSDSDDDGNTNSSDEESELAPMKNIKADAQARPTLQPTSPVSTTARQEQQSAMDLDPLPNGVHHESENANANDEAIRNRSHLSSGGESITQYVQSTIGASNSTGGSSDTTEKPRLAPVIRLKVSEKPTSSEETLRTSAEPEMQDDELDSPTSYGKSHFGASSTTHISDTLSRVIAQTGLGSIVSVTSGTVPASNASLISSSSTSPSGSNSTSAIKPSTSPSNSGASPSATIPPFKRLIPWSKIDDANLLTGVRTYGNIWAKVAEHVEGRTDRQCKDHWNRVLSRKPEYANIVVADIAAEWKRQNPSYARRNQDGGSGTSVPRHENGEMQVMGPWNAQEDKLLLDGHAIHGPKWTIVATNIPGRDSKQCQKRFKRIMDGIKLKELQKKIEEEGKVGIRKKEDEKIVVVAPPAAEEESGEKEEQKDELSDDTFNDLNDGDMKE